MKTIEVLLRDNVEDLGRCGDVVRVAPGYARNYLFPRRLVVVATPDNVRAMQRRRTRQVAEEAVLDASADALVQTLGTLRLRTVEKADENGHLFGSVNAATVVKLLARAGFEVSERQVRIEHPLKIAGEHSIPVHVRGERVAQVSLLVEAGA